MYNPNHLCKLEAECNNIQEAHALEEPKKISEALQDDSWVEAIIEAIRLFLAFASFMGFIVYQMDVKSAFLYGTIDEEVYVSQPPGFVDPDHPKKHGYMRGTIDKTLFIKKDKKDIMLVQVFQMSSMGELIFFLGLQVKQKTDGIFISQDKYVADMLKKFDLASVKTAITPMETKMALTKDEEADEVDVTPKTSHLNVVKRIFKYLKGKPNLGLSCCKLMWTKSGVSLQDKAHRDQTPLYTRSYEKKLIRVEKIHTDFNVAEPIDQKLLEGPSLLVNPGQADQAGTQSQPSSSTVPPPPTSQPAPTESTTIPPTPVTEPTSEPSSPSTAPEHETMEHPFEQPSPEHQPSSPRQESDILPKTQAPTIESLEKDLKQTKQTIGNAIVKLVKKVKKMEKVVKSRRVVLTDSEDEAAKNSSKQGRNLQKDESEVFETPKQGKSSGETDISPQGLEAAKTLAEALSQIKTKRRNVKTGVRRRLDAEDVSTGFEDVSTGFEDVSTGFTDIKSASEKLKRKRIAQVQEAASVLIKRRFGITFRELKLEANADLVKEIVGEDVSEADYAQRMVGLISQRRKLIAEQKAKAQRDKPMTQAQQRQYMATYLKNQGGWKLAQIKKLTDEELKEKFKYFMRSMERFVPMDTEKDSRKRTGVELQNNLPRSPKKKPESAKSGTEEDVEAYMEERVDETHLRIVSMSLIHKDRYTCKDIQMARIIKDWKERCLSDHHGNNTDVGICNFPGLIKCFNKRRLKELYRLMMMKYGDNRPEEEIERVLWGDLKHYV
ncbi:retrovirus-related pol polyprotein from transposon TNT 1-94 [Tanacetum coccineum]